MAESARGSVASATPNAATPAVPINVTASGGDGHVIVKWTKSANALGYNVYWGLGSTPAAAYTKIDAGDAAQLDVTQLTNGTPYYFQVTAYN
jgi:hypothetical protein